MRRSIIATLVLASLVGCPPPGPGIKTTSSSASSSSSSSSASTTGMPVVTGDGESTTTSTTGSAGVTSTGPDAATSGGAGTDGTTGEDCGGDFIHFGCDRTCLAGEICVVAQSGDTQHAYCSPNPDGCVPTDPCSPACAAVCGGGMLCEPTCGGLACKEPPNCLFWDSDCPEGTKCAPMDALGSDTWNAAACVPLDPDPDAIGEPCTTEGGEKTGVDSCAEDALCFGGLCTALCYVGGFGPDIECAPGTVCVTRVPEVLLLCEPICDPLQSQCPDGEVCAPVQTEEATEFACVNDASGAGGGLGDVCEYQNSCDPGMACVWAGVLPDCEGDACCTPYCDVTEPNTCAGPEQVCEFHGEPPPGDPKIGVCIVPTP